MGGQRSRKRGQQQQQENPPLQSDRGGTTIQEIVVSTVAGLAAQEIEGVQMGGSTSNAVGGFLGGVTGGGNNQTRGVTVEVGQEEAAVDLSMSIEYGRSIPQVSEAVRQNVINRVEYLVGLRVNEVNMVVNDVMLQENRPYQERQRQVEQESQRQVEQSS